MKSVWNCSRSLGYRSLLEEYGIGVSPGVSIVRQYREALSRDSGFRDFARDARNEYMEDLRRRKDSVRIAALDRLFRGLSWLAFESAGRSNMKGMSFRAEAVEWKMRRLEADRDGYRRRYAVKGDSERKRLRDYYLGHRDDILRKRAEARKVDPEGYRVYHREYYRKRLSGRVV